jgi:N-ethylmaleimide reductase
MSELSLSSPLTVGATVLANRAVMAPMTRSRALGNVPNALMADYYAQRAGAGLLITEGVSPSPNGLGYPRIPGIFSEAQVQGWMLVTEAVHSRGGKIAVQLMHTGRVGHPLNLPAGAKLQAPSAVAAPGEMYTDAQGLQAHPTPEAMTLEQIAVARGEYVQAAKNAVRAGFDLVELHGANGYLLEQFLSPHTNQRTDDYGGSIEARLRFVVEVAQAVCDAIGGQKVGIRLSPYGVNAGMALYDETDATHLALVKALVPTGLQFIHVVDHSAMGAPPVSATLKQQLRASWPRTFILAGGFDKASAEQALAEGRADLIAFGRPFLANPDLMERFASGATLNAPDFSTFYTPGEKGYTDYPTLGGG